MGKKMLIILSAGLLLFLVVVSTATAQYASLAGAFVDRWGNPAPALTVVLIHQPTGMFFQAWTDGWGRFFFPNIPPSDAYILRVLWGQNLIFQTRILVPGHINIGVIRLP